MVAVLADDVAAAWRKHVPSCKARTLADFEGLHSHVSTVV
jgi:hypothetical protein